MRHIASPTALQAVIAEADVEKTCTVSLIPWWGKSSIFVVVTNGDWSLLAKVVSAVISTLNDLSRYFC